MSTEPNTKQIKYFIVLVRDEGCVTEQIDDSSTEEFLPPAENAEQWDAENSFDLVMGNTIEGILELTQEQFDELQRRDGIYVPEQP